MGLCASTLDGEAIARGERHQNERKVGVKFHGILEARIEGGSARVDGKEIAVQGCECRDPGLCCSNRLSAHGLAREMQ